MAKVDKARSGFQRCYSDVVAAERIPALLHRSVARAVAVANAEYRSYGFNVQAARVLIVLLEAGPMRVGDLVTAVAIDNSTLSHLLRRLTRRKLLSRSRVEKDNRAVRVRLTAEGKKIASRCRAASLRHEAQLLKGFNASEVHLARELLRRICKNVEEWRDFIDA
jgi:DNA-binding MarR family transcriptional regulator